MKEKTNLKSKRKYLIAFGVVLVIALGIIFFQANFSGNVVLNLDADYLEGENLDGVLRLSLNNGEFIPASSLVVFENSEQRIEFVLEDIISEDPIDGKYYIQTRNLSGEGMGYGAIGNKKTYPELSFVFNVYSESEIIKEDESADIGGDVESIPEEIIDSGEEIVDEPVSKNETEIIESVNGTVETIEPSEVFESNESEKEIIEITEEIIEKGVENSEPVIESEIIEDAPEADVEPIEDIPEVEPKPADEPEASEETLEEPKEAPTEPEEPSIIEKAADAIAMSFASLLGRTSITGQVTLDLETSVTGVVSETLFSYDLKSGQTAELLPGSVKYGNLTLDDDSISFEVNNGKVSVSSNYFESEEGYGEVYLGDGFQVFEINLSVIGLNFSKGDLNINFVYNEEEVISLSTVLQEGKIEDANEVALVEPIIISSENLTGDELLILFKRFRNVSVETTQSEVIDGRLIRNYKIGDYELISSYDYDMGITDSLRAQMERDKINFLRDLAKSISEEEVFSEEVEEFLVVSNF